MFQRMDSPRQCWLASMVSTIVSSNHYALIVCIPLSQYPPFYFFQNYFWKSHFGHLYLSIFQNSWDFYKMKWETGYNGKSDFPTWWSQKNWLPFILWASIFFTIPRKTPIMPVFSTFEGLFWRFVHESDIFCLHNVEKWFPWWNQKSR